MHDWDKIEDLFDEDGRGKNGGGKKKKAPRDPKSKTARAKVKESVENSQAKRRRDAGLDIRRELAHVFEEDDWDIEGYLNWLNDSLGKVKFELKEGDLEFDTFKSGGNGGQNVNKLETGFRYRHLPSGIFVENTQQRTQFQNKKNARELLETRLEEHIAHWRNYLGENFSGEVVLEDLENITRL